MNKSESSSLKFKNKKTFQEEKPERLIAKDETGEFCRGSQILQKPSRLTEAISPDPCFFVVLRNNPDVRCLRK